MEAYLDNAATTRVTEDVADYMYRVMTEDFGNPSSMHTKGIEAEKYLRQAKETFAKLLRVSEKEIFFTSGGTESDNFAILGAAFANERSGKHLITTKIEHPAVLEAFRFLEERGYTVTYLDVDKNGVVSVQELKRQLRPDTVLVSVMYVNNEIGAIQPIGAIGKIIREYNPAIVFHVDAVQAFGKMRICPYRENIDLLSVSSHKIHGPKGVGVLFIKDKTRIRPIVFGGGQQKGMRSGTENVPGIAGMAKAAENLYAHLEQDVDRMYALREYFIQEICKIDGVTLNGPTARETSAPHIVNVSFLGIPKSEVLLHALEERGVYVSSGSACASNHPALSETLKAIGVKKELIGASLRFSFSIETTQEQLRHAVSAVSELLPVLRRYRPR